MKCHRGHQFDHGGLFQRLSEGLYGCGHNYAVVFRRRVLEMRVLAMKRRETEGGSTSTRRVEAMRDHPRGRGLFF